MEIYKITNTITQDFYIGSAINFKNRKWGHISSLRKNKHKNQFVQNSWNKYGEEAFIFEVLEVIDKKENLILREQYWIDTLSPTFNFSKIAGSPLGVKHTQKSRKNMSLAHIGLTKEERGHEEDCECPICNHRSGKNSPRYIPREERICVCGCNRSFTCMINSKKKFISGHNKSQLGRKRTIDSIEKQKKGLKLYYENGGVNPNLNKHLSDGTKLKISNSKSIAILQYDISNNYVQEWKSAKVAATILKISESNINGCLKGRRKTCSKFIWKYKHKN